MNVSEAITTRRAIKWYDPDHRMPEETFRNLMEHAILTPTAFNIQNWRFVMVRDSEQRKAIRAVAWDRAQVTDSSELIAIGKGKGIKDAWPKPGQLPLDRVMVEDRFAD